MLGASLEVWVYNDIYEDDSGAKQNIMPSDAVVLTCVDIDGTRAPVRSWTPVPVIRRSISS